MASAAAELDDYGDLGRQGVILAQADMGAGLDARTPLPDNDRSAGHQLPAESLHAEALRVRIAPIFRTAQTFFMCHDCIPFGVAPLRLSRLSNDLVHGDASEVL